MRETTPQGDRILNWWQYQQGAALVDDSRPGNNITLKPYRRKWYQIYLKRSQKYTSGNTSICDRLLDYKGTGLQSDLPSRHVLLQLIVRLTYTFHPMCSGMTATLLCDTGYIMWVADKGVRALGVITHALRGSWKIGIATGVFVVFGILADAYAQEVIGPLTNNWLQVFRRVDATLLGSDRRRPHQTRAVREEKCVGL